MGIFSQSVLTTILNSLWGKIVVAICVLQMLTPVNESLKDFRFQVKPLQLQLSQASPVVAALEDLRDTTLEDLRDTNAIELSAPHSVSRQVANSAVGSEEKKVIHLASGQASVDTQILQALKESQEEQAFYKNNFSEDEEQRERFFSERQDLLPSMTDSHGELLSLNQRKRILEKHYQQNFSLSHIQQSREEMFAKANDLLQESAEETNQQTRAIIGQDTGAPIYISRVNESASSVTPHSSAAPPRPRPAHDNSLVRGKSHRADGRNHQVHEMGQQQASKGQEEPSSRRQEPQAGQFSLASMSPSERLEDDGQKKVVVSGQLSVSGGLAYTGTDNHIEIFRQAFGRIIDRGHVWIEQGRYEIVVSGFSGSIVARLIDVSGKTLGMAEVQLPSLHRASEKSLQQIHLVIRPKISQSFTASLYSAYAYGESNGLEEKQPQLFIPGLNREVAINEGGVFSDPGLQADFPFLLDAKALNHVPARTEFLVDHGIKLFPESLIASLYKFADLFQDEWKKKATVMGEVQVNGMGYKGVEVEIAGIDEEPLYFQHIVDGVNLPNKSLRKTGANGKFAFLNLSPGIYAFRVVSGGQKSLAKLVELREGEVFQLDFLLHSRSLTSFKAFDPFNDSAHTVAEIEPFGAEVSFMLEDQTTYKWAHDGVEGENLVEISPGNNYEVARYAYSGTETEVALPLIQKKWINNLIEDRRKGQGIRVETKAVVFFSQEGSLLTLNNDSRNDDVQMIYFDEYGKALSETEVSRAFGVLLLNLEEGSHEGALLIGNTKKVEPLQFIIESGKAFVAQARLPQI